MSCCGYEKNVKFIVLLGAPGAGKGTVAQYLLDNYNVVHFSTGNLLRNEVKNCTTIGKEVSNILGSGSLVGDDLINRVVQSNILGTLSSDSIVLLDGYPRTVDQAEFLDSLDSSSLKSTLRVIEIDVNHEVVVSRIVDRIVCAKCGATFSLTRIKESHGNCSICDRCGGNLSKRADDEEAVVRRRLEEYVKMTLPVSKYYADRLVKVSGDASPEEVAQRIDIVLCGFGMKKGEIACGSYSRC